MNIELTENEIKTLKFYVKQSLIDAKGNCAIGIGSKQSVMNLESILKRLNT